MKEEDTLILRYQGKLRQKGWTIGINDCRYRITRLYDNPINQ